MSVVRTWMTKNKSDRLYNKGCHLKGQYNVTFSCTKGLSIQTSKRMATSASLCEGPIFYFYAKGQSFPSIPYFFFSFGKHHVVRKDLGTYVQLNIDSMSYYYWHHPWGNYAWFWLVVLTLVTETRGFSLFITLLNFFGYEVNHGCGHYVWMWRYLWTWFWCGSWTWNVGLARELYHMQCFVRYCLESNCCYYMTRKKLFCATSVDARTSQHAC